MDIAEELKIDLKDSITETKQKEKELAEAELSLLDQIDAKKTLNDASEEQESYN